MKKFINELKEKHEKNKERKRYQKILSYFKDFSLYESSILEERMEKEVALEEAEDALKKAKKENEDALKKAKKENEENTINIAKNLLKTNLDIKTISKCTGLSLDQIKNLPLN